MFAMNIKRVLEETIKNDILTSKKIVVLYGARQAPYQKWLSASILE